MGQKEKFFGVGSIACRLVRGPREAGKAPGPLDPLAGDSLRLNAGGDEVEAVVPCAVVEGRTEVVTEYFEQFLDEILQQTTRLASMDFIR